MTLRPSREAVLAIAMGLLTGSPTAAQTVQGFLVNDKTHAPTGNARVSLVDDSGHVAMTVLSDSLSGAFYLDGPHPGRYSLRILVGHGGLSVSPSFVLDSSQVFEQRFAVPDWPSTLVAAFLPDDVTKAATATRERPRYPRYPDAMRAAGRSGLVRASFVVDVDGKPDMSTFQVIGSTDESFTNVVRPYVKDSRYLPAERDGVKVPQVYLLAVDFGFGDAPPQIRDRNTIVIRAIGVMRRRP